MFKPAIVIPVFNHARTIAAVIDAVQAELRAAGETIPVVIIDDGSTDGTREILAGTSDITLLTHAHNRGKGAALLTAFKHLASQTFTHALTIDADGQHDPADLLKVIRASREHPLDLIMGERDMDAAGVPARSLKGRNAARFWLRIETGREIPDSQCGLRSYPLASALQVPHRFKRYDFETEILARLSWAGIAIRAVPVRCIYFTGDDRVSHFRPIIDTLRGVRVNVFLVARRLMPIPFSRLAPRDETAVAFGSWWKWATWKNAITDALRTGSTNSELAMAFALGIFVGLTPFYMLQTVLAIFFARRLHLNVLTAVIGSQISIPPLAPVWAALSYAVGHLLMHGEWVFSKNIGDHFSWNWRDWNFDWVGPFLLGNLLVALSVSVVSLFAARAVLYCIRSRPGIPAGFPVSEPIITRSGAEPS